MHMHTYFFYGYCFALYPLLLTLSPLHESMEWQNLVHAFNEYGSSIVTGLPTGFVVIE